MRFGRYDRVVQHYGALWPLLVPGYAPILSAMLDVVTALPRRPRRLLDLGCGPGSATAAVAPACNPTVTVTLVDGSEPMLRAARGLLEPHAAAAIAGDFTAPETVAAVFGPDRYDLALVSFALHHLDDPGKRATLERVAASLTPGGLVLLADEVTTDRPGGWDVVERIRARTIATHLASGAIDAGFWQLESSLPPELRLPFLPARIDDLTSWMARAGLAVSCPVSILGSALLVGLRPG